MPRTKPLGNKPQWQQAHLDRLRRMVERDKNHPSVIAWSMGTDAGNGVNFYRMYEWLKGYDPSRPVLYEQAGLEWNTDVVFLQHPALEELDEIGEKTNGRPVVLAECGYNWGNALGGLDPFWDSLMAKPVVQGGFLGPWKDEALMLDVNTLDSVLLYGGDIGPDSLPHDSNFCLKGLVSSAQVPHPALKEVKHLFQPVKVAALNVKKGRIRIENRYDFRPLSHLALYWQVLANGVARQSGTVLNLQLEPGAADTLEIPIAPFSPQAGQEYVLDLSFQLKQEDGLLPQGHEVARAQFILRERYKPEVVETKGLPELLVRKQKRTWIISTDEFSLTFDRDKGTITSYRYKGDELLQQGFAPFFLRAMTDMDRASGYAAEAQMWEDAHQRMYVRKACLEKVHDALIRIGVEYLVPPHNVRCRLIYAIFGSGDVVLDYRLDFEKVKNPLPAIPRIGMHLQMAPDYEFVKWYGRGPHESYSNRKAGAQLGIFTQHAATVRAPYLRPQAFGCKTDVRWLSLTNNSGKGLLISGMPLVSFTANAYPLESHWDNYRHNWELPLQDAIHLYIDLAQMGVGGMQPGRPVDKQWLLPANQPYRYHFRITPVDVMREVEELSVQDFEKDWMPGIKMED
ncbi:MAG: DUF4981 domain-containing protein [Bacteroidetes bacterium]|nr:MAG: DUF4981 domain-containing protein [Bacteroidota bacterium]